MKIIESGPKGAFFFFLGGLFELSSAEMDKEEILSRVCSVAAIRLGGLGVCCLAFR